MPSLFTSPGHRRLPLIAPSILSARFTHMAEDCRGVLSAEFGGLVSDSVGADLLHLDVMDGHFVPNLTMGPDMCRWLRREFPAAFLDVHLMVTDPAKFVDPFLDAGANHLTFHVEVMTAPEAIALAKRIRAAGATAGLAINPPTAIDGALSLLPEFDLILVMSVNPGFSGQKFIEPVLDKTRAVRPLLRPNQRLEMDGGITPENAGDVRRAGCDAIVAASAVFGVPADQRPGAIAALRG